VVRRDDIYVFRLVADAGPISTEHWRRMLSLLLELQPAQSVTLEGDPPHAIRVEGIGRTAEVAPGLLARLERLAMTPLRVEVVERAT